MPDETKMNSELEKLEAELKGISLSPESSLNRDDLMYQAGWAAAMASQNEISLQLKSGTSARGGSGVWKLATLVTSGAALFLGFIVAIQQFNGNTTSPNEVATNVNDLSAMPDVEFKPYTSGNKIVEQPKALLPQVDLMNWLEKLPSDQPLRSGLAFQTPNNSEKQSLRVTSPASSPSSSRAYLKRSQILDEILNKPAAESVPAWKRFVLPLSTRS